MRQNSVSAKTPAEQVLTDIRRKLDACWVGRKVRKVRPHNLINVFTLRHMGRFPGLGRDCRVDRGVGVGTGPKVALLQIFRVAPHWPRFSLWIVDAV